MTLSQKWAEIRLGSPDRFSSVLAQPAKSSENDCLLTRPIASNIPRLPYMVFRGYHIASQVLIETVPQLHCSLAPPGEKQSGEQNQIIWLKSGNDQQDCKVSNYYIAPPLQQ